MAGMILGVFGKQPADRIDYDVEYGEWLPEGDWVESASVDAVPTNINVDFVFVKKKRVKIWLSGGVHNTAYKITVTAKTAGGRIKQSEFKIKVKDV